MKTELKAVEILRMLAKDLSVTKECNPHKKVQTVEIHFTDDGKSIQEALAELAELTQEKSCETCRTSCGLKQAYIEKTAQGVVYCNAYAPKG